MKATLSALVMISMALAVLPTAEARTCSPPTIDLVCASAQAVMWDVAESNCGVDLPGDDCWYARGSGTAEAEGQVHGLLARSVVGVAAGGDQCMALWSCHVSSNGYYRVPVAWLGSTVCSDATVTATHTATGLSIAEYDTASC